MCENPLHKGFFLRTGSATNLPLELRMRTLNLARFERGSWILWGGGGTSCQFVVKIQVFFFAQCYKLDLHPPSIHSEKVMV